MLCDRYRFPLAAWIEKSQRCALRYFKLFDLNFVTFSVVMEAVVASTECPNCGRMLWYVASEAWPVVCEKHPRVAVCEQMVLHLRDVLQSLRKTLYLGDDSRRHMCLLATYESTG